MSEEPEHLLDSIGGFIGSILAGSQGYDPHLGHWAGSNATRIVRGFFTSNDATTEQILSMYAAIFRTMATSTGGLDDGRRERIVRMLTLLNNGASPAVDAVTLRRLSEDATRDEELIQLATQELSKDVEVAYTVLEVCFKYAALELVISDGMIQWLHGSALGVGLPQDRFDDLWAVYHRPQPDDARRIRAAEILGIPVGAYRDDADAAFEKLSAPYHPDRTKDFPPEIAELSAAKYRELGEAHDAFLMPTTWWGRATADIEAVPLKDRTTTACFVCGKVLQLPPADTLWTARCPDCLILLLHSKEAAEVLAANVKAAAQAALPSPDAGTDAPAFPDGPADSAALVGDSSADATPDLESALTRNRTVIPRAFAGFSSSGFYVAPNIPADKLQKAIGSFASIVRPVDVLALADTTVFGTATEGFLLTATGIYWRNSGGQPKQLRYCEITTVRYTPTSSIFSTAKVHANKEAIDVALGSLADQSRLAKLVATAIEAVSPIARRATATHATSDEATGSVTGKCPHCGKGFVAAASNRKTTIACMACKQSFVLGTPDSRA